ncbi:inorganic triphosphatase [Pasteurella oralis]|uniref:Inorganic triphosphatase n=1 Tax=Pasteurella oralis TaxID=1071947 RepID=A0ABW4NSM9_9PAST
MSDEIELKLAVEPSFVDFLRQEITHFRLLAQDTQFLGNCYYDTVDHLLAAQKMGLRVRQQNGQYTLTLKTDGEVKGGLHIRPEYNVALPNAEPNLTLLVEKCGVNLENFAQLSLQPVFSTDFERQSWLVECGKGSVIEVAFDLGKIVAGEKQMPICEVEFELKSGCTIDLLRFVRSLTLESAVRLSAASKAKRGYALANAQAVEVSHWLDKWREFLQFEQNSRNPVDKLSALFQLEQALIEETFAIDVHYFSVDFLRTVERIGAFFNLYHYYTDNARLLETIFTQQLSQNTIGLDGDVLADLLESNNDLFTQIRDIIRLHSETKNNQLALEKLKQLLQTGQYVKRMINLISLTLDH